MTDYSLLNQQMITHVQTVKVTYKVDNCVSSQRVVLMLLIKLCHHYILCLSKLFLNLVK